MSANQTAETVNVETVNATTATKQTRKSGTKRTRRTVAVDYNATAKAIAEQWDGKITARVEWLTSHEQSIPVEFARIRKTLANEGFVNALAMMVGSQAVETETLTRIIGNTNKGDRDNYVQAKTLEKVVNLIVTLAANDLHKLSDYTAQILANALHNGDALSLRGAQASLSRRVSGVDLPNKENLTTRGTYTVGTASAQTSQVRDALRILGIANVNKGKRGDTFTLNETRVQKLRELYALDAA